MNTHVRKTDLQAKPRRPSAPRNFVDPTTYPDQYATRVVGDCMAPEIKDGDAVMVDKRLKYDRGDLVIVYFRPEFVGPGELGVALKRIALNVFPGLKFPYKMHPQSNVMPILMLEQTNPPRQYSIPADKILAVHRCLGRVPAGVKLVKPKKSTASGGALPVVCTGRGAEPTWLRPDVADAEKTVEELCHEFTYLQARLEYDNARLDEGDEANRVAEITISRQGKIRKALAKRHAVATLREIEDVLGLLFIELREGLVVNKNDVRLLRLIQRTIIQMDNARVRAQERT